MRLIQFLPIKSKTHKDKLDELTPMVINNLEKKKYNEAISNLCKIIDSFDNLLGEPTEYGTYAPKIHDIIDNILLRDAYDDDDEYYAAISILIEKEVMYKLHVYINENDQTAKNTIQYLYKKNKVSLGFLLLKQCDLLWSLDEIEEMIAKTISLDAGESIVSRNLTQINNENKNQEFMHLFKNKYPQPYRYLCTTEAIFNHIEAKEIDYTPFVVEYFKAVECILRIILGFDNTIKLTLGELIHIYIRKRQPSKEIEKDLSKYIKKRNSKLHKNETLFQEVNFIKELTYKLIFKLISGEQK